MYPSYYIMEESCDFVDAGEDYPTIVISRSRAAALDLSMDVSRGWHQEKARKEDPVIQVSKTSILREEAQDNKKYAKLQATKPPNTLKKWNLPNLD